MTSTQISEVVLANPRGFCAGVDRAIEIVERALELYGSPIYVRHEVVHNRTVVDGLKAKGVIFIENLADVPAGQLVIFSAHGVSQQVKAEAEARQLRVFDATCPLVTKVHLEVVKYSRGGYECVLIGHSGHPEVEGTMGQFDAQHGGHMYLVEALDDVAELKVNNPNRLAYVTQTTLSMDDTAAIIDALRARFPNIEGPRKDDICYATQNRQDAVKELAKNCDVVLVVGSCNSSNSNRLRELAERLGCQAYLIDSKDDIDARWLSGNPVVGVTAGASAPEILVQSVVAHLQALGAQTVRDLAGAPEDVTFSLPRELRIPTRSV